MRSAHLKPVWQAMFRPPEFQTGLAAGDRLPAFATSDTPNSTTAILDPLALKLAGPTPPISKNTTPRFVRAKWLKEPDCTKVLFVQSDADRASCKLSPASRCTNTLFVQFDPKKHSCKVTLASRCTNNSSCNLILTFVQLDSILRATRFLLIIILCLFCAFFGKRHARARGRV